MPVRLLVKQRGAVGGDPAEEKVLDAAEAVVLGRGDPCDVKLAETTVSRTHAKITRDGALYFIEDLGSAFGTRVNGRSLPKAEKRLLRNGDVIAIGPYDLTFLREAGVAEAAPAGVDSTAFNARQVVKDVLKGIATGQGPYLRVMNGEYEGRRYPISDAQELVIGREDDCDIVLHDDQISRRHAKVRRDWAGTHVEDLGSRNGVQVNKKKVGDPYTLKDGDEVEVGATRFLFLDPSAVREAPASRLDLPATALDEEEGTISDEDGQPEVASASKVDAAPGEAPVEAPKAASGNGAKGADEPAGVAADAPEEEPGDEPPQAKAEPSSSPSGRRLKDMAGKLMVPMGKEDARLLVPFLIGGVLALACIGFIVALLAGM